ncbi:MAG: TraR/DksA family transcriptional regulator, partial [Thermodesulfobacteriota bacterium]
GGKEIQPGHQGRRLTTLCRGEVKPKVAEQFRKRLLQAREEIIEQMRQRDGSAQEIGQDGIQDIGDESVTIYNRHLLMSLSENERVKLIEVDGALDRIENGSFGMCEECEEPIALKRLEVIPNARYCVRCKEELEKASEESP